MLPPGAPSGRSIVYDQAPDPKQLKDREDDAELVAAQHQKLQYERDKQYLTHIQHLVEKTGDPFACVEVGRLHRLGRGTDKSLFLANTFFNAAKHPLTNELYPEARYELGKMCYEEDGHNRQQLGIDYLQKLGAEGYVEAYNKLADYSYDAGNYIDAIQYWEKAANLGSKARSMEAVTPGGGQETIVDAEELKLGITAAAGQAIKKACDNLADCYLDAKGVDKDYQEAANWRTKGREAIEIKEPERKRTSNFNHDQVSLALAQYRAQHNYVPVTAGNESPSAGTTSTTSSSSTTPNRSLNNGHSSGER